MPTFEAKLDWKSGGAKTKYILVEADSYSQAYKEAVRKCGIGWVCAGVLEVKTNA